jgi:hypothetical protein
MSRRHSGGEFTVSLCSSDQVGQSIPCAAMFVMCARGVLAVPGAALTIIPFRPVHQICQPVRLGG